MRDPGNGIALVLVILMTKILLLGCLKSLVLTAIHIACGATLCKVNPVEINIHTCCCPQQRNYIDMLIFQVLWSLMLNYHHIIKWHEQYDPAMHVSEVEQDESSAEATYNKNYIQQKLEHGLNRIWKVIDS